MASVEETIDDLMGPLSSPGHEATAWYGTQCVMTLLPRPTSQSPPMVLASSITDRAPSGKRILYSDLCQSYVFITIAVESSGSIGKYTLEFLHELGKCTRCKTKDSLTFLKLYQKISVCIRRFNSVSVLGCSPA